MLAFLTTATSTALRQKLVQSASPTRAWPSFRPASRASTLALALLLQAGSAALLVSAGFVVELPPVFGEWQQAAQYAVSLLWIVGAINAVNWLGRQSHVPAPRCSRPRGAYHRRPSR